MIKESRFLRALVLTLWFHSFLVWLYVAIRIVTDPSLTFLSFIYFIPWLSFWELGALSFIFSFISMLIYLYFWGFSGNPRHQANNGS